MASLGYSATEAFSGNGTIGRLAFSVPADMESCDAVIEIEVIGCIASDNVNVDLTTITTQNGKISVSGTAPTLTSVTLAPMMNTTSTLNKNTDGTYTVTVSGIAKTHYIKATALSAMGNNMIDKLSWTLTDSADANVNLRYNKDDDGVTYPTVEIGDKAAAGTYTLTATPKNGEAQGDAISVTIKIVRTASVPTTIQIDNHGVVSLTLPGDVDVYAGETKSTTNPGVIYTRAAKAFTATVYDQFGDPMSDAQVKWSFYNIDSTKLGTQWRNETTDPTTNVTTYDYCPETGHTHGDNCKQYTYINDTSNGVATGLEISPDGYLLVTNACTEGTAVVKAACDRGDGSTVYGFCSQEVTVQKKPTLVQVVFVDTAMPSSYTITIPADGAEPNTASFEAVAKDQYGTVLTDRSITYSVSTNIEGVEVPDGISISEDGTLTVANAAKNGISKGSGIWVTVMADAGSRWDSVSVNIKRADSVATSIAVYKDNVEITGTTDTVTIPTSGSKTATYTASVLDQYGKEMTDKSVSWTISPTYAIDGFYYTRNSDGSIKFTVGSTAAQNTNISLTASYGTVPNQVTRPITVSLKNIEFSNVQYTVKSDPTYGDQWSDIVTGISGTAKLGGAPVYGTFSLGNTGCPNAGEQTWKILFTSDDGTTYKNVEVASGTVNVAKKPLTVTANDAAITYGEAPTNNGVTYGDFMNNETKDDLGGTLDYEYNYTAGTSGVGSYTITPKGLTSSNYDIEFRPGTLTVTEKNLSACTVDDITGTFTYSGNLQTPAVTVKDGEKTLTAGTDYTLSYSSNVNAGNATVTVTGKGNYTGTATKNFTIEKKALTIVSATFADKTYDSKVAASVTGVTFSGLVEGESLTINEDYTAAGVFTQADVGTGINASVTVALSTNNKTSNYQLTVITKENAGQANISPATTTLTLTAGDAVYTGKAYDAGTKIHPQPNVMTAPTYTYYNDVDGSCGTTALSDAPKDAGTYWVKGSIAASGNYSAAISTAVKFQITKAPLTVTANNKTITYGDAPDNNGVSYSGFVNSETATVLGGTPTYSYNYTQYGNVGSYTITPDGLTSNNYDIEFKKGTLTVEQREVGISWDSGDLLYTGQAQTPAVTVTGTVHNDSVTATVTGAQTSAGTGYTATVTGLSSNNYKLPTTGLTKDFRIINAALTGVSVAQSGTLTYNGTAQTAAVNTAATAVGGQRVTFTYSTTADGTYGAMPAFTAADTYTVYYKASAANHHDVTGSFDVTIGRRTVTVGPKSYTITAGDAIPEFELEWSGVAAGDTLGLSADAEFDCLTSDGTDVSTSTSSGTYTIRWVNTDAVELTGTNAANYDLVKVGTGTLELQAKHSGFSGHPVSLIRPKNGSVSISPSEAKEGTKVTLTVTPDSGYELQSLTVTDASGRRVAVKNAGDGKYTFVMPDGAVTIRTSFTDSAATPFVDVTADKYFYDAVQWAVENGITGGTDATHFSPYASCTRGHLVTFLWRAAGEPEAAGSLSFSDVAAGRSCAEAVLWAAENGIVGGYDNGTFRPDAPVTRQQAAAILWRYAKYAGMDVSVGEDTNILSYNDAFDVSEYAAAAIQWAVGEGIMQGNKGYLLPCDTCTRAQIVTFLYRAYQG